MSELLDLVPARGNRCAVVTATEQLSYVGLANRVAAVADELGDRRRLVVVETPNTLEALVGYLGALSGGHVVLPVPPNRDHTALMHTYDPDVIIDCAGTIRELRHGSRHHLHPGLALLLSTSGSTGSPKLVRLSRTNLIANAEAIGRYLDIRQTDRAATTLPMSYCYGLSVVHSHLLRGASIILTDASVVDDQFWELFTHHRGTALAGVPYTFELFERVGFDTMELPHLRYITQAGGRMPPERVRRFAELGHRSGWQLFVMYGATEATARMAFLPAELALAQPASIGRPIPGGSFAIEPVEGWTEVGVGELVYRGPNVMMGYAQSPVDLASGNRTDALRTGDIARRNPDGLYEVIGRRSRFVKLFGLRIDLERLETTLRDRGVTALCTADEDKLVVAAIGAHDDGDVQGITAAAAGVPAPAICVVTVAELPLLASGKPDYQAVRQAARLATRHATSQAPRQATRQATSQTKSTSRARIAVRDLFADVLQVDPRLVDAESSFVSLGGDSLSYVAMSVRLEHALGRLPRGWAHMPVKELEYELKSTGPSRRWFGATLETGVALRAVAIVLIVGSHAGLIVAWGGAHILLGVAGYNFGRFSLAPVPRADRVRHLRKTIAWIAVPSIVWIAIALVLTNDYHLTNLLLLNKILGPHHSMTAGRLWFVEVLIWVLLALMVVCWLPFSDRAERRHPFGFAAAFLAGGLALRYDVFGFDPGFEARFSLLAFWFFAVGWTAAKSSRHWQRIAVTIILVVSVHGYFQNTHREALVMAGLLLLIWLPAVQCPTALILPAGMVAEASLYTYLTHFQVYPFFGNHALLGVLASLAVGVLLTTLVSTVRARLREQPSRPSPATPASTTEPAMSATEQTLSPLAPDTVSAGLSDNHPGL